MGTTSERAWQGPAAALLTAIAGLAPCRPADAEGCATGRAALQEMLGAEQAFHEEAKTSVPAALLDYLADDTWVLHPGPERGRLIYPVLKDGENGLQWYPATGDIASSGEFGYTSGPWVYRLADGKQRHGHFLSVWQRDSKCRWQLVLASGISHGVPPLVEPRLLVDAAVVTQPELPPPKSVSSDAAGRAISDFQATSQQDGFSAALRTYGRNNGFILLTEEQLPIGGVGAASRYLNSHPLEIEWTEDARGRSADSSLMYTVGELTNHGHRSSHAYVQIWQYDPKVANWGLRMLLINPLPLPKD